MLEIEEIFEKLVEARNKALEGEYDMSGYYAGIYKDLNQGNFSFETNVYDITTNCSETIPEDIIDYYAVMVDMHN